MKSYRNVLLLSFLVVLGAMGMTGCELGGLDLQKSEVFHPHVLDPHTPMTAWQYLNERSDSTLQDTVLLWMKRAVQYAGMDSAEYQDTGRTFIFLHNDAVMRISKGKITTDCYFGKYQVVTLDANGDTVFNADGSPKMRPAADWKDYPKQQVKDYLEYLIIKGEYSFENLTALNTTVNTLLPARTDTLNPRSIMTMLVTNDGDSNIELNNFFGSAGSVKVRTGGILCTNGPVHVIDRVLYYSKQ